MGMPDRVKLAACTGAKNAAGAWAALFTGAAGTNGANEATGARYARQQLTYTDAVDHIESNTVAIPVEDGSYPEGGVYDAETGGNFGFSGPFMFDGEPVTLTIAGGNGEINFQLNWQ